MPKICYSEKRFGPAGRDLIDRANAIIAEYQAQGFTLTLRQLYYQFVARGFLPNRDAEYKRLGGLVSDARRAGMIDWLAIEDRTRFLRGATHWGSPAEILKAAADGYATDKWRTQKYRPEVWIEKDALIGVIEGVCQELDISCLSCRGYVSDSAAWRSAMRLKEVRAKGQFPAILHLGDHDPSGVDMTRDIGDRLGLFLGGGPYRVLRLALTMEQVRQYNPPPNPAKLTDSRCRAYIEQYGEDSWELDALDPAVLAGLVRTTVLSVRDEAAWKKAVGRQERERKQLRRMAKGA